MTGPEWVAHTQSVGRYCELMVLARLAQGKFQVAVPFGNQTGWDLLAMSREGSWERWQVKAAVTTKQTSQSKNWKRSYFALGVELRKRRSWIENGKRVVKSAAPTEVQFDVLVVVDPLTDDMWKIPASEVAGASTVRLHRRADVDRAHRKGAPRKCRFDRYFWPPPERKKVVLATDPIVTGDRSPGRPEAHPENTSAPRSEAA